MCNVNCLSKFIVKYSGTGSEKVQNLIGKKRAEMARKMHATSLCCFHNNGFDTILPDVPLCEKSKKVPACPIGIGTHN
jgi:hypothetical protein